VNQELLEAGRGYVKAGLTIIPVNPRKKPAIAEWKSFENGRHATLEDIEKWSELSHAYGWAVICGEASGGLIVLDFDVEGFYERWREKVGHAAETLPVQRTGGGGYQVAFKASLNLRNDKLAYVPADNIEGREVAIEIRSNGGYAVLPGSFCREAIKHGKKHSEPYKTIQGDFCSIPTITPEQARELLEAARSLDACPKTRKQMRSAPLHGPAGTQDGLREAFNQAHSIHTILERNGYKRASNRYLAPASTTGDPGVHIFEDTGRCYSYHANCSLNDGFSHDAFSAFCILEHGNDFKAAAKAAEKILGIKLEQKGKPQTGKPQAPTILFVTARELQATEFKDPEWIIKDILPEGLCLLSARPKKGKTRLAINLSVATSTSGCALGKADLRVTQGKVLYLCLEDKLRRAKQRLKTILGDAPFPEDLILAENWPRLDKGGLEALKEFLKEHDDCRLVVVDSYSKIKPLTRPKNTDPYDFDMAWGGALQSLAQEHQVCLLLIYHNRKAESNDPLDDVIGSTGLTAAADAVLILRRGRGQADGTLLVTGRDVPEKELALKLHSGEGLWELMGDAAEYALSKERREILSILRNVGPRTPAQLANILGKSNDAVRINLTRMKNAGIVTLNANGEYQTI